MFDLDDTLLDAAAAWSSGMDAVTRRCPGVVREVADAAWSAAFDEYFDAYLRGELTLEQSRHARIRAWWGALGLQCREDEVPAWWADYEDGYTVGWVAFSDVKDCLEALADLDIGVVTNGDGAQQRAKLAALDLTARVQAVVISGELGCAKPDPAIFRHAAALLEADPAECLFVGDRLDADVRGAHGAGMAAVWLNRGAAEVPPGVRAIASLSELTTLVDQDRLDHPVTWRGGETT